MGQQGGVVTESADMIISRVLSATDSINSRVLGAAVDMILFPNAFRCVAAVKNVVGDHVPKV